MITKEQFTKLFEPIAKTWPKNYSAPQLNLIFSYLKPLSARNVERIVRDMLDSQRYAPLPRDFRDAARAQKQADFERDVQAATKIYTNPADPTSLREVLKRMGANSLQDAIRKKQRTEGA